MFFDVDKFSISAFSMLLNYLSSFYGFLGRAFRGSLSFATGLTEFTEIEPNVWYNIGKVCKQRVKL